MATILITKNSTVASKRPTAANLVVGELGLNLEASDPGLYFEDSAGNIRKVGGCAFSATAPNVTPAGQAGNSVGELWYDTVAAQLKAWDGTAWTNVGGINQVDWQSAAGAPTVTFKADGITPLVDGDLYWDSAGDTLYGYDVTAPGWKVISGQNNQFDWQTAAGFPTATFRADGVSALVDGDQYWDSTANLLYSWDAITTAWVLVNNQFDWQSAAGVPTATFRADGVSALVDGDQYWDSTNNQLYAWDATLAAWRTVGADTHAWISDTALTTRPDGTALVPGDIWWDSINLEPSIWYDDGTSTQWVSLIGGSIAPLSSTIVNTTTPATRNDGSALQTGDLWQNTTNGRLYYYDAGTTSWIQSGTKNWVQDIAPTVADGVYINDTWTDSTTMLTYVYYNDGTSTQWVQNN